MRRVLISLVTILVCCVCLRAQDPNASVSGRVLDPSGGIVPRTQVTVINDATNVAYSAVTNEAGIYYVQSLPPGKYHIQVSKSGFKNIIKPDVVLHVQDAPTINFTLEVGAASESVTVEGGAPLINTENAAVSTVIDRQFVESLPLNGRSFNTLLQLTPGVVIAPANFGQTGQFSIAGQRTDANSFSVDGVSVNFGVGSSTAVGEFGTGGAQAFSVLGSTSSLVSVDALQEFRIETSSFAPEFGKTPGGQVILSTRSGTNNLHGGIFDYFRNTVMDANDWFNNASIPPKARAPEHHNDFGGFLGGPIWKDKTFFFFSYEGARLRLPETVVIQVPSQAARMSNAALAPYLNAYPQPNGPVFAGGNTAQFTGSISTPATLDATSIRIDQIISKRLAIFGRYNYAPSQAQTPFGPSTSLSNPLSTNVDTQTLTVGLNMTPGQNTSNMLRANYSTQVNRGSAALDSFGAAVPLGPSLLLGALPANQNSAGLFFFDAAGYTVGSQGKQQSWQANFTDALSVALASHQLKVGGDYRAIFLDENPPANIFIYFSDVATFLSTGSTAAVDSATHPSKFLAQSLSLFAQDTWKAAPRLTLTYGLRWELSPAPSARGNTILTAWQNVNDPAMIAPAPVGTPLWATTYGNFAPRFGLAYSLTQDGDFVLRAGIGIFYDLGVGESAQVGVSYPNSAFSFSSVVPFPVTDLSSFLPAFPTVPCSAPCSFGTVVAFSPSLSLPRSYQWNLAIEKSFRGKQAISATYVSQAGRDQLRNAAIFAPNTNFSGDFIFTNNSARSNYNALQVQFRRPLSARLQAVLNYTWGHSLDNASDDVTSAIPGTVLSGLNDYASSSFDVRQSFSGALSYDIPAAAKSGALALLTGHWSLQSVIVARTGFPFNGLIRFASADPGGIASSRPDRVPGEPLWIPDQSAGGGMSLNPNALVKPPTLRQGTEGRNDIPGFGLTQMDLSLGRKFPVTERVTLQFRTDAFNLFNHPNFANPAGLIELGPPGLKSSAMLNLGLGGLSPLFQEGGPRSLQLSLKLTF